MAVQNNIAAGYLSNFESPIGVSVMSKLTQWPFLQQLGFAGALPHLNSNFHGLGDFNNQLSAYSSTNAILIAAWSIIKQIAPNNPLVTALMYTDPTLGQVGKEFQQMSGFGQAFAISPSQLKLPASIPAQVASGSSSTPSLSFSTTGN